MMLLKQDLMSDGPFEIWDYVGISKGVELMKSAGLDVLIGLKT